MKPRVPILLNAAILVLVMILAPEGVAAQDAIATALDRIHREYSSGPMDTARLVLLDRELRGLIPYYSWQERPSLPATYLQAGYGSIGVRPALFEGVTLTYSGKLLAEAHSNDPHSPFRSHTLYSTIFWREGRRSTDMPSPDAAKAYVNEFPQGPFIVEAHLILAGFYDDLYKVITLEEDGRRTDYKYDCYKTYLTAKPLPEQRQIARESAIRHYERLFELLPLYADLKPHLVGLREDRPTRGWFNCGD